MARGHTSRVRKTIFRIKDESFCPGCGACPGWLGLKGLGIRARGHTRRCRARSWSALDEDKGSVALEMPSEDAVGQPAAGAGVLGSLLENAEVEEKERQEQKGGSAARTPPSIAPASASALSVELASQEGAGTSPKVEISQREDSTSISVIALDAKDEGEDATAKDSPASQALSPRSPRRPSFEGSTKRALSEHSLGSGSTAATAKSEIVPSGAGSREAGFLPVPAGDASATPEQEPLTRCEKVEAPAKSPPPAPALAPEAATDVAPPPAEREEIQGVTEVMRQSASSNAQVRASDASSSSGLSRLLLAGFDVPADFRPENSRNSSLGTRPAQTGTVTTSKKGARKSGSRRIVKKSENSRGTQQNEATSASETSP
mmetsp:Transcript_22764/g.48361  ORF Transcript_22764/g.48361 Transcript_22764/m.48361 type:complete len:375 (+) Transcript_22764:624-1748(+)|eukprot:CAMPEP_0206425712 /NCGR_PEP_ID=MMETSP0324_2-20121206/3950_1 /ASSEMBLY_ACC=CAM_ASM_000836 /TAXON_ID=2866 /ORGANISM="Crypthecodinium cohnii, Strain Seligo" /LENGTH=374 /DNA_ID=CAMNT_0053890537 /DNA_START=606 /DNA_END=1730 /DNA_ORIENTATION=+